jgi:hypothetical protein
MRLDKVTEARLTRFKDTEGFKTDSEALQKLLSAYWYKDLYLYNKDGPDY